MTNNRPVGFWWQLLRDEQAQDLVEYSLILAFIALAGAAAYLTMAASTTTIWGIINTRLAGANQSGT